MRQVWNRTQVRRALRLCAILLSIGLVANGCGDDGDGDGGSGASPDSTAPSETTAAPRPGGRLTMATYIEPPGLDPLMVQSGVVGGIEAMAIYDTVVRWNRESGEYEMRTAESVEANDDFTKWTITLKEGVRFTDGTPYDAEALRWALDRHRSGLEGAPACTELRACPRNAAVSSGPMATVASMTVTGPLTLEITMKTPWPGFPAMLAAEPGMVPSPTAMKAACPEDASAAYRDCPFALAPVGAGPFKIVQFRPKERIVLERNDDYWGDAPYLDSIEFVNFGDAGGERTYEFLRSGDVDLAFLRGPKVIAAALDEDYGGISFMQAAGTIVMMNNGVSIRCASGEPAPTCTGQADGPYTPKTPTQDLRVRKAVAAALDPAEIFRRVYGEAGSPGSELFPEWFENGPDLAGPKYDLAEARRLVEAVKAEGWDGRITYLTDQAPVNMEVAQSVQAMLGGVGMTVEIVSEASAVVAQRKLNGDYHLASHGFNITDDDMGTARNIASNMTSTSRGNRMGYKSPAMDAAIAELFGASETATKQDAYHSIAEQYVADIPFLVLGSVEERPSWHQGVHDVYGTVQSMIYFDKVWIGDE